MNSFIDSLNLWGACFLDFAVPMLWQSSLLIAVVFAADILLRRKIRAAVRYSLWFVVFVKLMAPPTLALPTGAAWWLRGRPAPVIVSPHRTMTVHYSDTATDYIPSIVESTYVAPPAPKLSRDGWVLISAMAVSGFLAAWLVFRWRQVARCVRRTAAASEEISEMLVEARRQAGLRRNVALRVTSEAMSPAVCGLFKPVILLPQSLMDKLTANQLRAVLLHELIHLRRLDVWVNCAQTLLQIFYWWHPLFWLANARVRRVREEAVDDAVMCALSEEAEIYAPTLLEVAKLAFSRPLASLGLVGILESRNALRHRIERLLNFATPRRAGVSVVSVICLAAFTALAVPMGEPPARPASTAAADDLGSEKLIPYHAQVNPEVFLRNIQARAGETMHTTNDDWSDILVSIMDGVGVDCTGPRAFALDTAKGELTSQNSAEVLNLVDEVVKELNLAGGERILNPQRGLKEAAIEAEFYELRPEEVAKLGLKGQSLHRDADLTPWWGLSSPEFANVRQHLKELGIEPLMSPRIQTYNGILASMSMGDGTNDVRLECVPYVREEVVKLSTLARTTGTYAPEGKGWPDVAGHTNCAIFSRMSIPDGEGAAVVVAPVGATRQLLVLLKAKIVDPEVKSRAAAAGTTTGLKRAPDATSLLADGKSLFELGKMDEAEAKLKQVLKKEPDNQAALYYLSLIRQVKDRQLVDSANIKSGAQNVPGPGSLPDEHFTNDARWKIYQKLNEITLDKVAYVDLPLGEAIRNLTEQVWRRDSDQKGVNFLIDKTTNQPSFNPSTGEPIALAPTHFDMGDVKVNVDLRNVRLLDVLEAIVKSADHPIKYSLLDYGVEFSARDTTKIEFHTRTFRVDTKKFFAKYAEGANAAEIQQAMTKFLAEAGVKLAPPESIFFKDRQGTLTIHATDADLERVESALTAASFLELTTRTFDLPGMDALGRKLKTIGGLKNGLDGSTPAADVQTALVTYFRKVGVGDLQPPGSVSLDYAKGTLTVQATDEQLNRIRALIGFNFGLEFTPPPVAPGFTRTFKLNVNTFFPALVKTGDFPVGSNITAFRTLTNESGQPYIDLPSAQDTAIALLTCFSRRGVNLYPPKSLFFNARQSTLTVRATEEDLGKIEQWISVLNDPAIPDSVKAGAPALSAQTFKLDGNTFFLALQRRGVIPAISNGTISTPTNSPARRTIQGVNTDSLQAAFRDNVQNGLISYFQNHGVDLQSPKSLSYDDWKSTLTIRATQKDLGAVEQLLSVLNARIPEVTVKARFVEVNNKFLKTLFTNGIGLSAKETRDRVLTEAQFDLILKALQKRDHMDLLNEGEVTTLSGRQANFQVVDVTTLVFEHTNQTVNPSFDTKDTPFGTFLDVIPQVNANGKIIQLKAIPQVTEFLGYENTKGKLNPNGPGTPKSRIRQTVMEVAISDGATLMVGDLGDEWMIMKPDGSTEELHPFKDEKNTHLVVFITPTIIDAAGNRVNPGGKRASSQPATNVRYVSDAMK